MTTTVILHFIFPPWSHPWPVLQSISSNFTTICSEFSIAASPCQPLGIPLQCAEGGSDTRMHRMTERRITSWGFSYTNGLTRGSLVQHGGCDDNVQYRRAQRSYHHLQEETHRVWQLRQSQTKDQGPETYRYIYQTEASRRKGLE